MDSTRLTVVFLVVAALIFGSFFIYQDDEPPAPVPATQPAQVAEKQQDEEEERMEIIITPPPEIAEIKVEELTYLPDKVSLKERASRAPNRNDSLFSEGNRRLTNIRPVTDPEKDGHFIAPRFSPDGLQMIVTRPGYQGVYVMPVSGGEAIKISDANAYHAKWTPEGKIEVRGEDGMVRVYGADGALESTHTYDQSKELAFSEGDTIYFRTAEGEAAAPLTGNDDRYFNPVLSPDGETIVYQGLYSGLYMAPADGSGEPVYIGEGNNPVWSPDSDGIFFDFTQDDGHALVDGDIQFADLENSEISNLTEGAEGLGQMPSVGPDGSTVLFESDGGIFAGDLQ